MNILSIDTATAVKTAAILSTEDMRLTEVVNNDKLNHSETLMPLMAKIMEERGMKPEDLDLLVLSKGPGSYTGLRIGAATMKGLALSRDLKIVGLSSLEVLAENYYGLKGLIVPMLDARRKDVFAAVYRGNGHGFEEVLPARCIAAEDLLAELKAIDGAEDAVFVGDGTFVHKERILSHLPAARIAPIHMTLSRAGAAISLAMRKMEAGTAEFTDAYTFSPDYLRDPYIGTRKERP